MTKPVNHNDLTSTQQAIINDHIRAGVTPPKMEPPEKQIVTHKINVDELPED